MYIKKVRIRKESSPKDFEAFLLELGKKTQKSFNHFGKINKSTIDKILEKELKNSNKIKFFVYLNKKIIAYGFLNKFEKYEKQHNSILGIVVADKWQSKGIGKILLNKMIKEGWRSGLEKIWLNVHFDNKQAFRLYRSVGFEIEGIFYDDEKFNKKFRHIISMAIFKNKVVTQVDRLDLLKLLTKI